MANKKKTFVFVVMRHDSPEKVIFDNTEDMVGFLKGEIDATEQKDLLEEGGYSITYQEISEKDIKKAGEFDGF